MTDVEEVKSRVNIVEIVSEKVQLKKAGVNYFGLCPFHQERTPSFSVNEQLQIFKCFGCGAGGDVYEFIKKTENVEFRGALEILAVKAGYELKDTSNSGKDNSFKKETQKLLELNKKVSQVYVDTLLEKDNEGWKYAEKRGITPELITAFKIGYASDSYQSVTQEFAQKGYELQYLEKSGVSVKKDDGYVDKFRNRLMFAVQNERGEVVGFSGRFIGVSKPGFEPPKYLNTSETIVFKKNKLLFGLYQAAPAIRKVNFVILTEGQMNIISSHKVGVGNIVASLGTSFTEEHAKLLQRYTKNIYLAFDKDTAGKKALIRTLAMLFRMEVKVKIIDWDEALGKDPDEVIVHDTEKWIYAVNHPVDPVEYLFNEFKRKFDTSDAEKVQAFLRMIKEIINANPNSVQREFYVKYLAEELGVTVTAVQDLMKSGFNPPRAAVTPPQQGSETGQHGSKGKNEEKRELTIFDKIFVLLVQNWSELKSELKSIDRSVLPDSYKEMLDFLSLFEDMDDIHGIYDSLDPEMVDIFQDLMLVNLMLDEKVSLKVHFNKILTIASNEYKRQMIFQWKQNPDDPELFKKVQEFLGKK